MKLRSVFSLLIVHCSLLFAQLPTQEWVARIPGPSNDLIGPFFAVDKQGNSYVAGTRVINDSINILCAKYNTLGGQEWLTLYKYPGEGYFAPTGLELDNSGNAYLISYFAQTYLVPYNGLIVKFNSLNGSPVWAKRYVGQYGVSAFLDIKIDRLNNIYVVGASDTSHLVIRYNTNGDSVWVRKYHPPFCSEGARACTIDDSLNIIFTGNRIHTYDTLLVAKYSSSGVLRWESTYAQGVSANVGLNITADQNGNLYIGGITNFSGAGVYLTLKYDRNGVQQWAKIYDAPGGGDNNLRGIAMDRINNAVYVTGGAISNGRGVAATIKYNSLTGDTVWVRTDSGSYNMASSRDIARDSSGNVYITGETYNFPSYVPYDILTVKYSMAGNQIWRMTYNGTFNGLDIGKAIRLDVSNNVYVLGTSQSGFQMSDYVLIKYNQILGVEPISNEIPHKFALNQNFPNPFNPNTRIKFSVPKISFVQINIFDVLGRFIEIPVNEKLNPSVYEITVNALSYSSGVYFYQLIADGKIIDTKKFIVVK